MIDYETYARIKDYHHGQGLTAIQIARQLELDPRTVEDWLAQPHFRARRATPKPSKLDPFKPTILRLLEHHPYTTTQIFHRLQEDGYHGGFSILKEYVRIVRPKRAPAFLTLNFAPGECAQVDWGEYGSVAIGSTRRRLSFFLMVLCHSRMMYLEFTPSQTMEHFLACHRNAFDFFGGVPARVMVDNLKSAVLHHDHGQEPILNSKYSDFANYHGFSVSPCNVAKGNEKGRVENGVGYVKKNLLNGLEINAFEHINPAARIWLDTIANVRIHGETKTKPIDLLQQERPLLKPVPLTPYDVATIRPVVASNRFRVSFETNRYSVPADFANYHGFSVSPCNVGKGNEKGRVENGVGYVKKNLLNGLEINAFDHINPAARIWLDTIANVRIHGETKTKPIDLLQQERPLLKPLPPTPYDVATIRPVVASNRFRVSFETNRYSVPAEFASARLSLKAYPDHICILYQDRLIARHIRSFDRHQDIEDPDHPRELLEQRKNARQQKVLLRFLSLSPRAQEYHQELSKRRLNSHQHITRIVALAESHGAEQVGQAMADAFQFQAFSAEYIANILEQRARPLPQRGALHLTRRQDLLDLEVPPPNLSIYDQP